MIKTHIRKGFTLLEILLVIALIGILVAISLVAINPNRQLAQSRDLVRKSDINKIYEALEYYRISQKNYPAGITGTKTDICDTGTEQVGGVTNCSGKVDLRVLVPKYLLSIPTDPSGGAYQVYINPNNSIIGVEAPGVELAQSLAVNPISSTTAPTPTPTPVAWTPANITTQLWLDAADSSTVTTVSSKVSQWNDKSGNARNATQSTDANRPTYTTAGLNGLNVVTFTTTSFQSMVLSSVMASGSTSGSIFWVQKNDQDPPTQANAGALFHNDWSTDGAFNHAPWEDGNIYTNALRNSRVNAGNPTPLFTSPRILGIESNSSSYKILIDGTSFYTAGGSFVLSAGNKTLGVPSGYGFRGYAAEIIVVNSVLSSGDREKIEGYLAHKWGITGNLDVAHPYKSVAPTPTPTPTPAPTPTPTPAPSLAGRLIRGPGAQTPTADFRNVGTSNPVFNTSSVSGFTVGTALSLTNVGKKGAVLLNWNGDSNAAWNPTTKDQSQMVSGYSYAKSSGSGWITKRDGAHGEWLWTKITAGPTTIPGTGGGIRPATQTSTESIDITVPDTTVEHTLTVIFTTIFGGSNNMMKLSLYNNGTTVTYDDSVSPSPGQAIYQFKFYGNCVLSVQNLSDQASFPENWPRMQALFID